MHTEVRQFLSRVRRTYPLRFIAKRVLEVGSLNINGSAREYFYFCEYTGIDIGEGDGVDIVIPAHEYDVTRMGTPRDYGTRWDPFDMRAAGSPRRFDVVVSTEMLEHDVYWKESLTQMYENLERGGLMVFTCAGPDRPEHGTFATTPQDSPYTQTYYRNISMLDFSSVLPPHQFTTYHIMYERGRQDLMFYGIKNP